MFGFRIKVFFALLFYVALSGFLSYCEDSNEADSAQIDYSEAYSIDKIAEILSFPSTKNILDESIRDLSIEKGVEFGLLREKRLRFKLDSSFSYNDNIYLEKDNTKYDFITCISPGAYGYYGNSNHLFLGFYDADIFMHGEESKNNRINQHFGARAYLFKNSPIKISLSDTVRPTTYAPTSENTDITRRLNNNFQSTVRYDMSPKTSLAFSYEQIVEDYISSAYKDFSYFRQNFKPALYWHFSPKTSISADYTLGLINYYEGKDYDSLYHQFRGGIEGKLTPKSSIYLKGGCEYRNYYTSEVKDRFAFVLETIYDYLLSPKTALQFIASSSINESVYEDVGYYKSINTYVSCSHNILNNLDIDLRIFYIRSDYPHEAAVMGKEPKKRSDNLYGASATIEYTFRNWISVYAQYDWKIRDSNIRNQQYANNVVSGGVKWGF